MKKAFTMIELIFVIVIIGILAVIAIPKLTASRDDAKKVVEMNNIANCIQGVATSYTSQKVEDDNTQACKDLVCASVNIGNKKDGKITVSVSNSGNGKPKYCDYVKVSATKQKLTGTHLFGGSRVKP